MKSRQNKMEKAQGGKAHEEETCQSQHVSGTKEMQKIHTTEVDINEDDEINYTSCNTANADDIDQNYDINSYHVNESEATESPGNNTTAHNEDHQLQEENDHRIQARIKIVNDFVARNKMKSTCAATESPGNKSDKECEEVARTRDSNQG